MRALIWDVHGTYTDALLGCGFEVCFLRSDGPGSSEGQGSTPGQGSGQTSDRRFPGFTRRAVAAGESVRFLTPAQARDDPPDVVIAQRVDEVAVLEELFGDRLGRSVGAVFLEHNTPRADVPDSRHPLADRAGWTIVHVTWFNQLFWDCGTSRTVVIEHGLPDPGLRYRGTEDRLAFVVNEPVRRWRVTGTDLLPWFAAHPVDAFGIDGQLLPDVLGDRCPRLAFAGNLSPAELRDALVTRRAYLHLNRWTSLGLSLIEAMLLGLPAVVLETTEAARAVPTGAGVRSTDPRELVEGAARLLADPAHAAACGRRARAHALDRYGFDRFRGDWHRLLADVASHPR
ncbi:hypothetical protein FHX74_002646 [Friedmanniella endophytica]|uniref:Glycosyl transferase family 1 domain-containing protein n=1 Tax=Microlunatus kandeliicorticis TaxID=1759536 RepID=A0A7W3ITQ3_9ACTN|nr:glycosyltransferase [Microlunatus kandeliicorticis]MBA8795018.1 hypothetical protein [Microlunatus kandeliicorticis]